VPWIALVITASYNAEMKSILVILLADMNLPALADTYTGVVAGTKHFRNEGVVVDLDAKYPTRRCSSTCRRRTSAGLVRFL
jgi:hypothetical protein